MTELTGRELAEDLSAQMARSFKDRKAGNKQGWPFVAVHREGKSDPGRLAIIDRANKAAKALFGEPGMILHIVPARRPEENER